MLRRNQINLTLITFLSVFLLSCALDMVNTVTKPNSNQRDTGITFEQYKIRERNKLLEKLRNKTDKNYSVDNILINTALLNKNGKVFRLQSKNAGTRKKKFLVGEHPTNDSHIKAGDYQLFDPTNPNDLNGLEPYEGNSVDENGFQIAQIKVNNTNYKFEPDVAIIKFKTDNSLTLFQSLYNAEVLGELDGYYKLKIDINKSPIEKTELILEELNKSLPENIKDIEFSSISAFKQFIIMCDFLINYTSEIENIEFNLFSEKQIPVIDVNDWLYISTNSAKNI